MERDFFYTADVSLVVFASFSYEIDRNEPRFSHFFPEFEPLSKPVKIRWKPFQTTISTTVTLLTLSETSTKGHKSRSGQFHNPSFPRRKKRDMKLEIFYDVARYDYEPQKF